MINAKFIKNLALLDIKQLDEFEKFLVSPYFLRRKNLPALFTILKKNYPNYKVSKQVVYAEAFPGKKYNDVLMRKYLSELNNMLNDYLAVSGFQKDKMTYGSKLIDRLIDLKNYDEA
jgi:hypothetical protein